MMCEVILFFAGAIICALLLWVFILDSKLDDLKQQIIDDSKFLFPDED